MTKQEAIDLAHKLNTDKYCLTDLETKRPEYKVIPYEGAYTLEIHKHFKDNRPCVFIL
jgi:hypothetical protein